MNTPPPPSVTNADALKAYQRLCHVIKRQNFDGYGFNLHSEKGKIGQYIGKIDANSPAETAGLKEGDRIIEVNGVNIGSETHKQVVQRIKAISNEVQLLIIDPAKEKEILQMQKTILNATAVTTKSTNVGQSDPEILTSSTITIKSTSTTSSSAKENNKVIMSTFAKQPPPPSFTTIVSSSTEQAGSSLIIDDDDTQKVSTTKKETERTITSTSSEIKLEEPAEDIVDNCNIKIPIFDISKNCEKDSKLNSTKNNAMKLNDTNNHNFNQNNFQHTDEIFITNNENNSGNSINNIHLNNNNLNKNQTNFNYEEDNMDHKNSKSITETITITTTSINDDDYVNGSNNNKHSNDITIKFDASKNIDDDIKEKTKSFQETIITEEQNNRQQQYIGENEHSTKTLCNDNDNQNENLTSITTQQQQKQIQIVSEENKNDQKSNNEKTLSSKQQKQPLLNLPMTAAEMRAKLLAKKKYDPKNDSVDLRKKFEIIQKL